MPATPWDREYESHKGVAVRGALHSQVRLEKNKSVKGSTVWKVVYQITPPGSQGGQLSEEGHSMPTLLFPQTRCLRLGLPRLRCQERVS